MNVCVCDTVCIHVDILSMTIVTNTHMRMHMKT